MNAAYPEGTSDMASEQNSATVTAFPQPYSDFLQTQWNAADSVEQKAQEPVCERYEPQVEYVNVSEQKGELYSAPQAKVENVPQAKVENAPQDKVENVPQDKVENIPQDKVESVPQDKVGSVTQDKVESPLQNSVETAVQDKVETLAQAEVETVAQAKVETVPQEKVETAPLTGQQDKELTAEYSQRTEQQIIQEQQIKEQSDSTKHVQGKETISQVNNSSSTESPQVALETTEQQTTETNSAIPGALTKTIRTVKVSEEYSHERKETEILKARSGGIVTETVKTGATESNIKHESVQKSTEISQQGAQIMPPGETNQSTVISKQISEHTESENYIIKREMHSGSEQYQDQKLDAVNTITNEIEHQQRINFQEMQEMKDYFVCDAGNAAEQANPATAPAFLQQVAGRPRSPPPPPRSSPIDPQLQALPHPKKRISMLEALTIAPEKPFSPLSVGTTGNIPSTALPGPGNMPVNVEQSRSKTVKNQYPKAPVKTQQQEIRKQTEYTALTQQEHTQTFQEKEKRFSARTGLCQASIVPQYQQDLERFQMQRALSPAPHYRVPGSRSPSPAPDPEAFKHAYRFNAPLEPQGMHKSAKDLETVSAPTRQQIPQHKQVPQETIPPTFHITAAQPPHFDKNMQTKPTSSVQHPFKQMSQEKPKKQTGRAFSGLRGATTLPYYQKDLERFQIQRALSPAPHFRIPGSRSPSPAPLPDPESFKHAYRFGGQVEPRGMHKSQTETETITATTQQQMSSGNQIYQHTAPASQPSQTDKRVQQSAQKTIPKLPQHQDKKAVNQKQMIQSQKQVSFSPNIKVATPFQQAGFQTQKDLPFPHIPLPGDQAAMCPPQNVAVPNIPLSQEPHIQPPSALTTNVPPAPAPAPAPPFQDPKKPSCTAAPPAGGGGGVGGGKASGTVAGSTTPRRGRGILNQPGARIPLCGSCNSQIRGPFITALGKIWCPEHFICVNGQCRRPLQDIGFVEEKGELYCEFCFEKYIAPTCDKCNTKIKGDCLNAIGKHFHPECFLCAYCGKLFGNSPFFLEDGLPYCEADWNELFTTKCFACGFPIEAGDRWVEALNNNYHSQCFNCTNCKKNLEGESFYAKGGRPFCKAHAR